jgi:hypothetical protein
MTTATELDLEERLRVAGNEFQGVHSQLSAKKIEFAEKGTTCSQADFAAMASAIQQLQLIEQEKKAEFSRLEREYAVQLDSERERFTKCELLAQRQRLEEELDAGQKEIDTLQAQITLVRDRIGTLIHQRNRILPQLALLPRTE